MDPVEPFAVDRTRLGIAALAAIRLRRGRELAVDGLRYAGDHELWWLLAFAVLLALVSLTLAGANAALPVVVYTLV